MLVEDCCFGVNESGQVQTNIHKQTQQASQLKKESPKDGSQGNYLARVIPGFLPFLGSLYLFYSFCHWFMPY
jgi:hypothetical protein